MGLTNAIATRPDPECALPEAAPDDICYLQYSSGSTRFPTGVAVTHRALLNEALLDAAEATGQVEIWFNHAIDHVDWEAQTIRVMDGETRPFEVLVGWRPKRAGAGSVGLRCEW